MTYMNGATRPGEVGMVDDDGEHVAVTPKDVKAILLAEINDARTLVESSVIADRRQRNIAYYNAELFGGGLEVEGRSKIVIDDVRNAVEWTMPSLMRMFTGGTQLVEFLPGNENEEESADQATEWAHYNFFRVQRGTLILYSILKGTQLENTQVARVYHDGRMKVSYDQYAEASADLIAKLQADKSVTIIEKTPLFDVDAVNTQAEQGVDPGTLLWKVRARRVAPRDVVCVDHIPSENMMMSRRYAWVDDDIPFIGDRCEYTKSDLIAMGFPRAKIQDLPANDSKSMAVETQRAQRFADEESGPPASGPDRTDWQMERVWLNVCYPLIDEDGDGIAERRQIYAAGDTSLEILEDIPVSGVPYVSFCPIPMPHKMMGVAPADLVAEKQLVRSFLGRNILDNIVATNNQRYTVVENQVDLEGLVTTSPGGVVVQSGPGMVDVLPSQQLGSAPMDFMRFMEEQIEATGNSKMFQGLDAGAMNQTAMGVGAMLSAAQARILLQGMLLTPSIERMFKLMLRAFKQAPMRERVIRLRGKFVEIDPSTWNEDMDLDVHVGLGVGQQQMMLDALDKIAAKQQALFAAGFGDYLVDAKNVWNTARKFCEAAGFKVPQMFFTDPTDKQPPPPKPDPLLIEARAKDKEVAGKSQNDQTQAALRKQEQNQKFQLAVLQMKQDAMLKKLELESNERIALAHVEAKHELEIAKAQAKEETPSSPAN